MRASTKKASDGPPALTELEMTIFGPGKGECIVLHLGGGDWMVIDSCKATGGQEPVALDYFDRIGVDPATSVRTVLATHYHDDHIQGLARVLRECSKAKFVMSAALAGQQFFQLVWEVAEQNKLVKSDSSATEFSDILEILDSRRNGPYEAGPDTYAQDGNRIYQGGHDGNTEVWALSPSAGTITNAHAAIAEVLVTSSKNRRFKKFSPNDLSVAILVQTSASRLLLGADLVTTNSDEFGWKAVLSSDVRPQQLSHAFKIPHHGSAGAHHDDVWSSMLIADPIAVVTPFSGSSLPRDSDVERIKKLTSRAYCTTWPRSRRATKRKHVDRIAKGATKSRRAQTKVTGHVRLRLDLTDPSADPTIDLFGSATQLS